ncbi:beta-glucosidase-like glycosyl hydrolase [Solirubrobacter pauli]|uniref:Exo-alpha-(1->6)-L-arabinopyranosidase n=1 Tax=Solirubrobacter pauli TaxID=166793 RepID=A0A660LD37_9ACTN|nr:glycoside hydrolase family 3 C-terminal domain-containing protein [Solirubrobacter pauli]RKQ92165.1 beta-glucosidase-like glycosyl hydrolase [Solirubrobacter pauli]
MRNRRAAAAALAGSACLAAVASVGVPLASGRGPEVKVAAADAAPGAPIYLDRHYSYAERAADLVARMTTAEKASQLVSSQAPAIPRLGIRPWGQWNEALHGVSRSQLTYNANATTLSNTTSYPTDQTMGSSWDPDLMYRVATQIGDEAREVSPDNVSNLDFYSPTMNLERDPRWGRTDETYGEDPFHTAAMVSQFVNGMEGKDEQGELLPGAAGYYKTLTTLKHYAANNSEVNRRSGSSDMDDRTLREYYTAAFRDVVRRSDPGSVMSSYNSVNAVGQVPTTGGTSAKAGEQHNPYGAPTASDPYLIDTLLRQTFGFDGYVTSDCDAVQQGTATHRWTIPSWPSAPFARPVNTTERNALAQSAGEDSECNTGFRDNYDYLNRLPAAARDQIKTLVDTYTVNDLDAAAVRVFTSRMKLGEFDDPSLNPWVRDARSRVPQGSWTNDDANQAVTETPARLALAREAGDKTIVLLKNSRNALPLRVPTTGAPRIAVMGLLACPAATTSGQATTCPNAGNVYLGGYSSTQLGAGQANIVTGYDGIKKAVQAINPNATVDLWRGFTNGTNIGTATTVDPAAVAAASGYDQVVVYAGTDLSTANEDQDRTSILLPGAQDALINQVAAANPSTTVYMETIGPVDISAWEPNVGSILWSSYNGQRKGEALADVLLGAYNPSAHLPSTWYANLSQLPEDTDYTLRPTATTPGRTYQYYDGSKGQVRYPFGHGLSYTTFAYRDLAVDDTTPDADATLHVSVDVANTGAVAGTDIPQLYVTTPDAPASAQRPLKRLKGFEKVTLAPGETKRVTFTLKVADLAFFDQDAGRWVVDPGRYGLQVARSSAQAEAQTTVTVRGTLTPTVATVEVKPALAGDAAREIVDRVQFPEGAEIVPNVTVALSDDSLYGFVRNQRDTATGKLEPLGRDLPAGMTITYASNRPDVVRVDGGHLRTVADGVATITATAHYRGGERSRDFVVKVASEPTRLTLNGASLDAVVPDATFTADVHDYDVILPEDVTSAPTLGADAPSDATVQATQAAGVPGTATVHVTGPEGNTLSYSVHFAHAAQTDEFTSGVPGSQWHWIRRSQQGAPNATPGSVQITTEAGDVLSTPTATTNNARNLLLQRALGDWTVETKVDVNANLTATSQQVGLIAYQDDDNYLKFVLAGNSATAAPRLTVISEDRRSCCDPGYAQGSGPVSETLAPATLVPVTAPADLTTATRTIWLRMSKTGARYRLWYSTDGSAFKPVYETGAPLEDVDVGLFAVGPTTVRASFDYLRVSGQTRPATIPALEDEPPTATPTPQGSASPTPTPQGAASPAPTAAPRPDKTPPLLRLRSNGRQHVRTLRTNGLAFRLSADEPVTQLEATLLGRFSSHGKRLALRRLARQTLRSVKAGQTVTLELRPSAALRKRLAREHRLPALLRIRATDAAGNVTTRTKPISFR